MDVRFEGSGIFFILEKQKTTTGYPIANIEWEITEWLGFEYFKK
jgi:hypothetical protein